MRERITEDATTGGNDSAAGADAGDIAELFGRADDRLRVPHPKECLYVIPSTICNLGCRFCAYSKSTIDKRVMPLELFRDVIERACEFGFRSFGLTPMLGEVFTDPGFSDKLRFLEQHSAVRHYSFCTNFTRVDDGFLELVGELRKLRYLSISIYGHDEPTFARITNTDGRLFTSLLANLIELKNWPDLGDHVELRIRTSASFEMDQCDPRLRAIVDDYARRGARIRIPHDRYSNWGGLISERDLTGLEINLKAVDEKPAVPCAFLFYKHTVLPDGRINACYAEDGNATMIIGDLTRQSFSEIYSRNNRVYMGLIASHLAGRFRGACHQCSGYRPITTDHYSYESHELPFLSLNELARELS